MKTSASFRPPAYRFAFAGLALAAALWTAMSAHAQLQVTNTIAQLAAQGFTEGPAGYSLRVTGLRNGPASLNLAQGSTAVFEDIFRDTTGTVRAHKGTLQLYGLTYKISLAAVATNTGVVSIGGQLTLFPPFDKYLDALDAQPDLGVDRLGNIGLAGGQFTIPKTIQMGRLRLENVTIVLDSALQGYGGGMDVSLGEGPTTAFCVPAGSRKIHGDFLVVNGTLNQLGVGAANLKRPLGTSGGILDRVTATVGNLAANSGRDWFLRGDASVIAGCPINGVYPFRMDAQATVNSAGFLEVKGIGYAFDVESGQAYFRYSPPYNVAAGGSLNFGPDVFIAECGFQVTSGPQFSGFGRGLLQVPRLVPVVGGYKFAQAEASFNNTGFRGSVTVNVSPEIPSVCTAAYCLPGGCTKWWSPKWNKPGRICKNCWDGTCYPRVCTPRIPAVSATVGFKYESGRFTFGAAAADPMVEPWEKSFQETVVDPATGDRLSFMGNWARLDKCSTGPCGRPIAPAAGFALAAVPPVTFELPPGEESVMFRLTWENPNNTLAFMSVQFSDYPALRISSDEVSPEARFLRPLDTGTSFGTGAYLIIDGSRREAIIGIPRPPAGVYSVQIDHTEGLGNYAVELLRQNVAPVVAVEQVFRSESPTEYVIRYSSTFRSGVSPASPPTRFFLSQVECVPGTTRQIKSGGIYLVGSIPSVNGANIHYIRTDSLNVPDGDYNVIVNIDDPSSLEVEAFSRQKVTVRNASAPAPVPSFATRGDNGSFTVNWQPSPSPNIVSYIVAYTKSALGNEFEFNVSADADARSLTVTNVSNGQPYLVTVFAMNTNGLQSCPAEKQRVIPTEGYGLNAPIIVSAPPVGATVDQPYVYLPELFDADNVIRPSAPLPEGELAESSAPADAEGRQWTLVTAPAGMTIGSSNGLIAWTPAFNQAGSNTVTVRVTDLSSLPPLQDAGSLVSPRFGEQTYNLFVVDANSPPHFERNHYRFLTAPPVTAYEGEVYRYVPVVLFPTNKFTLTIDDGPPGLTVVQEGTAPNTANVVLWTVSAGASGHRVVLRAVPDLGASTVADDTVLQEYYLDVSAPAKRLPQPTVITRATTMPEGFGLRWVGGAASYQVQRSVALPVNPAFRHDFNSPLPAGAAIHGSASLDLIDGVLQLNPDANDQLGSLVLDDFAAGQTVLGFEATFRMKILPTTPLPAEGFSFNWATDLPNAGFGEEGAGSGLTVSFDTYDNPGGEITSVQVSWNGVTAVHQNVPVGMFINSSNFADVLIRLRPGAGIDILYAGQRVIVGQSVPGATPLTGARFGIGARTGTLRSTHTVDDLTIQTLLTPAETAWQSISAASPAGAVNFHVDTNPPPARAFYRIRELP